MGLRDAVEDKKSEFESVENKFLKEYERTMFEIEKESQENYSQSGYLSPSSIYGCKRKLFFRRKKAERDKLKWRDKKDDKWFFNGIGMRDNGSLAHERIQFILDEMGKRGRARKLDIEELVKDAQSVGRKTEFLFWDENKYEAKCMNEDLKIRFFADGAINFNDKDYLIEIKTISLFAFNKLKRPKKEHIIQATSYAYALNVDRVIFIYEDRNFLQRKVFIYNVSKAEQESLKEKTDIVQRYVEESIIPPAEKSKDNCKYCNYKGICERVGDENEWED